MMNRRDFLRYTAAYTITLATDALWTTRPAFAAPGVGDALPSLALPDLKGNHVAIPGGFGGKVILLHFWATWCSYCINEMTSLEFLYKNFEKKGFSPFSVNVGQKRDAIESYLGKLRPTYPILLDADSSTVKTFGVTGIPTTFITDRKGIIRYKILGEITTTGLRKILLTLL
ncbi:MAG TPA: TlpA disulfide reductase family protein [Nitrospirota bacterium]|nr:TlpA disulfide reductase family protein [Nitrospirota bacterium]